MNFPEFDPDSIQIKSISLNEWLRTLPNNSNLRVFHCSDESVKQTWIENKENNEVFLVSEEFED